MTITYDHSRKKGSIKREWAEHPHDCLVNIFTRLTFEDRWRNTMFVCKSWLHATKDPSLYTVLDVESYFLKLHPLKSDHWWVPSELVSWWSSKFVRKIDNMIRSVVELSNGGLMEIGVRHCYHRSLSLVTQRCPNLEVLSIRNSQNVTDESMMKVASGCLKLKEVDISYCYKISHISLEVLEKKCTDILILKRNHIGNKCHLEYKKCSQEKTRPKDNDITATIGMFMPQLLHLNFGSQIYQAEALI